MARIPAAIAAERDCRLSDAVSRAVALESDIIAGAAPQCTLLRYLLNPRHPDPRVLRSYRWLISSVVPVILSYKNTSVSRLLSPFTRFEASDVNATTHSVDEGPGTGAIRIASADTTALTRCRVHQGIAQMNIGSPVTIPLWLSTRSGVAAGKIVQWT